VPPGANKWNRIERRMFRVSDVERDAVRIERWDVRGEWNRVPERAET
jgi:hypothetical protein